MNRRHVIVSLGAILIALTTAVVLVHPHGLGQSAFAQSPSPTNKPDTSPTASPTTSPADSTPAPRVLSLPGTLAADESVEMYAKASGYVSRMAVDIGSRVRKGDVLVQLDIPEMHDDLRQNEAHAAARRAKIEAMKAKAVQARLMIESALADQKRIEAELALSRITHERKAELHREKAIPQQEFDVAENQLAISKAELAISRAEVENARGEELAALADVKFAEAELNVAEAEAVRIKTLLGYTTITAPFDGVITRREVDHGDFVRSAAQGAGSPLLLIEKVDRLRLVVDIPEPQAPLVRVGTEVEFLIRANGGPAMKGKITRTASSLRSETRTMRAEIDLDNAGGELMPGMFAKVSIPMPPAK